MSTTDTDLQQLVINVGTTAQIEAAIQGGTITSDMLSITTDGVDGANVDMSNVTSTGKEAIINFVLPDYSNSTSYTHATTFYADKDYYIRCNVINGDYSGTVYTDSALQNILYFWRFYINAYANACQIPCGVIPKGTYYYSNADCTLFPIKGE